MLREILRPFKLFWIVFKGFRAGIAGTILMLAGALCFLPATAEERAILGADTQTRQTLIAHRAASLMVKADSDRLYIAIADSSVKEDLSPWQVRFVAERLADGTLRIDADGTISGSFPGIPPQTASTSRNFVRSFVPPTPAEGLLAPSSPTAKFVSARTN